MSTLWLETTEGYVRADAVTGVAVVYDRERSTGWRLVVTVMGGGSQGSWDSGGGEVSPGVATLSSGQTDPTSLDHLPGAVVRALVRYRNATGIVVFDHRSDSDEVTVEFQDWSDLDA